VNAVLAYLSAAIITAWGIAHAIPTRQVLAGFSPITRDNRRVLQQEWLAGAVTMYGGDELGGQRPGDSEVHHGLHAVRP
jgi:hypothetical protein